MKRLWTLVLLAALMALGTTASYASANSHQDHTGACSRATTSVKKMVGDFKYNNVLTQFASAVGIHRYDGPLQEQMEEQLVQGTIARSTTSLNHECVGNSGQVNALSTPKYLAKGEAVIFKAPPKYGKEACKHPNGKCKKVRITVKVVFPHGCGNENNGEIEVWIWVRKQKHPKPPHHKKPHHKKPPYCKTHRRKCQKPKTPPPSNVCSGNNTNNGNGSAGNCNTNVCVGNNVCNEEKTNICVGNNTCNEKGKEPPCGCHEHEEPPTCTGTPEQCHPKNGEEGPGNGTPGQPGGEGAGGNPSPPSSNGNICHLPNGDVGEEDQFGYCNPIS